MSKRLQVLEAIKSLVAASMPTVDVQGLTDDADRPKRISPFGLVIVRDGDPGEPSIDLCPPTYHYDHSIPVELAAYDATTDLRARLDEMAGAIGAAVVTDRFLGGLCTFVEVDALEVVDLTLPGGKTQLGAQFTITASYHTSNPLG